MAARLRKTHQEDIKTKIKVSNIIDRLEKHINGHIELTNSQVASARILLDKTMSNAPTDTKVAHTGEMIHKVEVVIVDAAA